MKHCPTCRTGNLSQSGAHLFCDNCNFSQFVMTDDYLEACKNLLAELISNTRFKTIKDFATTVDIHIQLHLPKLDSYAANLIEGRPEFMVNLIEQVKERGVNVVIGGEVTNPEEASRDLRCQCGSTAFSTFKISELYCENCNARYDFNELTGLYEPYFLCSCGCAAYREIDESGLCRCRNCLHPYMYDEANQTFRRL